MLDDPPIPIPATSQNLREQDLIEAMDKYGSYILRYLNSISRDAFLSEDIAQQLWVYVYEKFRLADFKKPGFLKNKAYQLFVDEMRKRKVRDFVIYSDTPPESSCADLRDTRNNPDEPILYERFWEQFHGVELTPIQKQIFWLHHRYGYTMKEVSEIIGIAPSTAHDWLTLVKSRCLDYFNNRNDA